MPALVIGKVPPTDARGYAGLFGALRGFRTAGGDSALKLARELPLFRMEAKGFDGRERLFMTEMRALAQAADAVVEAGLYSYLERHPGIVLVVPQGHEAFDVTVVVSERFTAATIRTLTVTAATAYRLIALIVPDMDESQLSLRWGAGWWPSLPERW